MSEKQKTVIYYRGLRIPLDTPFVEKAPTPFVEVSYEPIRYGEKLTEREVIRLTGQLPFPICGSEVIQRWQLINSFRQIFDKDFQPFLIDTWRRNPDSKVLEPFQFWRSKVKIVSVEIEESRLYGAVDYSVVLESLPQSDEDSGLFPIIDPSFKVDISENEDGTISVTGSCSATGIIPASHDTEEEDREEEQDPLQNAINYVQEEIEKTLDIVPSSTNILGFSKEKASLVSEQESIDRLNSTYSLTREYTMNMRGSSKFKFQSSTDVSYSETDGVYSVSLSGSISGGPEETISSVREEFDKVNVFGICSSALNKVKNLGPNASLNPNPVSQSIDESEKERVINFSFSFSSDSEAGDAVFEYDTTVEYNAEEDSHTASMNGTIRGLKGQDVNYNLIESIYGSVNVRNICQTALLQDKNPDSKNPVLKESPSSFEVSRDEVNGNITVSASYAEKKSKVVVAGFEDIEYSIDVKRPIKEWKPFQTMNNQTRMFDIECFKRGRISLSGRASLSDPCPSNSSSQESSLAGWMEGECRSIISGGQDIFIESIKMERTKDGKDYNFSIELSFWGGSLQYG